MFFASAASSGMTFLLSPKRLHHASAMHCCQYEYHHSYAAVWWMVQFTNYRQRDGNCITRSSYFVMLIRALRSFIHWVLGYQSSKVKLVLKNPFGSFISKKYWRNVTKEFPKYVIKSINIPCEWNIRSDNKSSKLAFSFLSLPRRLTLNVRISKLKWVSNGPVSENRWKCLLKKFSFARG